MIFVTSNNEKNINLAFIYDIFLIGGKITNVEVGFF